MNDVCLKMALCEGRHEIPEATDGYVFPAELAARLMRYEQGLEDMAAGAIAEAGHKYYAYVSADDGYGLAKDQSAKVSLNLYVTGLTVALIATLNACRKQGITVTLYHYDKDSGDYYPQKVD